MTVDWDNYCPDRKKRDNENAQQRNRRQKQPCLHDACTQCHGTGTKDDGSPCVHHLSCPCPRCTVMC